MGNEQVSTPEDTAPISVVDKGYKYPMWWEDLVHGDVVEDEQGDVYQVVSGCRHGTRDCYVQVYEYVQGKWYPATVHRRMQELVYLRAVNEWRPNDDE